LIHGFLCLITSPHFLDLEPVAMPGFATTPYSNALRITA
jgi:hypothetical protein